MLIEFETKSHTFKIDILRAFRKKFFSGTFLEKEQIFFCSKNSTL